jgi:hypothetical protein
MSATPSFRAIRWSRTANLLAQAVLLVTLCVGLNYLAGRAGWRLDLTATRRNTLSAESLARLRALPEPVRIVCTFADDAENPMLAQARRDLAGLLTAYVAATRQNSAGRIDATFLDVHLSPREAKELKLENQPDSILVLNSVTGRRRLVGLEEIYLVENNELKAFHGEQALTAAILDVTSATRKKIYFLTGHDELVADHENPASLDPDKGLLLFARELQARNYDLLTLDLSRTSQVPTDAELVIIAGPANPVPPNEVEKLRSYLKVRAGRVIALLGPAHKHGLDDLLDDWGVLTDDVVVVDAGPAGQNDRGELILTAAAKSNHPAIRALSANSIPVRFGATRAARLDPGRRDDPGLVISELIGTGRTAWGERNYSGVRSVSFNKDSDLAGPFAVATASERVSTGGLQPVPGGRLIVVGSTDWLANKGMSVAGNVTFALAAVNWAADRNAALALGDIPARPVERLQLTLTQAQLRRFRYTLVFALPGAVALLGLAVFWARRR